MLSNKVTIKILGNSYYIRTDSEPAYVEALAAELNDRLSKILASSTSVSVTQAAVLAALEYADDAEKTEEASNELKAQLKAYLEDAAKARSERDYLKRELERLKTLNSDSDGAQQENLWDKK